MANLIQSCQRIIDGNCFANQLNHRGSINSWQVHAAGWPGEGNMRKEKNAGFVVHIYDMSFCLVLLRFIHSFLCLFIHSYVDSIHWLIDWLIGWLVDSFIQSCIHSVIDWFIHSFSRSKGWMWGVELTGYSLMLINGPCGLDRHISCWTHRLVLGEGWEATHLAVGQGKG